MLLRRDEGDSTLQQIKIGTGVAIWKSEKPQGTLQLHWSPRGAVRMFVDGTGAGGFARLINKQFENAVRETGRVLILFDLSKMRNYDTQLRLDLTDWCVANKASIEAMHLHTESKVVLMGTTVANILLRGLIDIHSQRSTFDAVIRKAELPPVG